jgi:hypothetical protein
MLRGRKFGGRRRTYSTINETQKKKLSHTHTQHDEPLPPYPERLCPLSPWVGQLCQQNMAPPLPIAMWRRRAIGVAIAVVVLLVWGGLVTKIEIERGGGRLGLRWPPFYGYKQQSNRGWLRRWKGFRGGRATRAERVGRSFALHLGQLIEKKN